MRRRMLPTKAGPVSPSVVAQRLCDLLLSFPSAASSGVQWHTLVRKYEEKHSARLDLKALGHSSPLAAATALLWDVLRLVDAEDTDNPVVAVEDAVVLTPRPKSLGTWPSLYQTLQSIVLSHGTPQKHADINGCEVSRGLLLSQLKPLLQIHWDTNFEEGSLGYLSDEGTWVRVRKMKHLVQAVLRWRDQRVAWQTTTGCRPAAVDEAITHRMDLVCSRRYNDLVLRCVHQGRNETSPEVSEVPNKTAERCGSSVQHENDAYFAHYSQWQPSVSSWQGVYYQRDSTSYEVPVAPYPRATHEELTLLRAENAQLRQNNERLLLQSEIPAAPTKSEPLPHSVMVFDDPFEPPPERLQHEGGNFWANFLPSPVASTAPPSERDAQSTTPGTPISMASPFVASSSSGAPSENAWADSGPTTPTPMPRTQDWLPAPHCNANPFGLPHSALGGGTSIAAAPCALMPMPVWFPSGFVPSMPPRWLGDRGVIPNGIVQQARAMFEPAQQPMHPQL